MLEQMQTKDKKPIWKKIQYKGSLLVEYAIILGLAAIFLVFNGLFDPIGDKAENNAKAVNKDAYVYGGVPKGSVNQPTDDNDTPPTHSPSGPDGPIIVPDTDNVPVKPGDDIKTNIQFTYKDDGKIWMPYTKNGQIFKDYPPGGNKKYFSIGTLLSFGSDCIGKKYRIFFNDDASKQTTNKENGQVSLPVGDKKNNRDFGSIEIQVITYKDQNIFINEVLKPSGIDKDGYFSIGDVELYIDRPCYVAFNFRGVASVVSGNGNDDPKVGFINKYMKIVEI